MIQGHVRRIVIADEKLESELVIPHHSKAIILFAHGSGSSRQSARNQQVARALNKAGFATLLVDLLTPREKEVDEKTSHLRFDINLLATRIEAVTDWLVQEPETRNLEIGYFGSSTGAAAAVIAAARLGDKVKSVVCRGGRLDLADERETMQVIKASILLIVGSRDTHIVATNKNALKKLANAESKELVIIPDATHLFEEPSKISDVAEVTVEWFSCSMLESQKKFQNPYPHKSSQKLSRLSRFTLVTKFKDRTSAGEILASSLAKYKREKKILILAILRGGVIVGDVVAKRLNGELNFIIARKLRAPENSEKAIGAIMQDGSVYIEQYEVKSSTASKEYIEAEIKRQKEEIEAKKQLYNLGSNVYHIKNRVVILVDDGAASGATLTIAARWVSKQHPTCLIIAVPVASKSAFKRLVEEADIVKVIKCPSSFRNVEQFYDEFQQVEDSVVIGKLR